jgi:hypothetical protein
MWIGDDGKPLDYLPERATHITQFVYQTAEAVMAVADAELAELRAENERLRATLREAVGAFAHPTHPGRACRQSGHVPVETLARWGAALAGPEPDTTSDGAP